MGLTARAFLVCLAGKNMNTYTCIHTYTHVHMHIRTYTTCKYMHTRTYTRTTHMHAHMRTYTHTCTNIHMHTYIKKDVGISGWPEHGPTTHWNPLDTLVCCPAIALDTTDRRATGTLEVRAYGNRA